jgi:hypothetical protein
LRDEHVAELARLAHPPHLLHHRVVAQVVTGRMPDPPRGRATHEIDRLGARHGQRLFADHVFAGIDRGRRHRIMLHVGRAHVHDVERDVAKDRTVIAAGVRDAKRVGHRPRLVDMTADNRDHVREAETPDGFEMHSAHETGSNDCGTNALCAHALSREDISPPLDARG